MGLSTDEERMDEESASTDASPESTILAQLQSTPVSLDQLVRQVPQLTWNQVFQAVDGLSRTGSIQLRRKHFRYELSRA